MQCNNCVRNTLRLFVQSFARTEILAASKAPAARIRQQSRCFSSTLRPRSNVIIEDETPLQAAEDSIPSWKIQKAALKEKLGGEAWNPRKKLSPDTMEGIRHLNKSNPSTFTTPVLAEHFKVSPEAIRRILKSNWRPTDTEYDARMARWDKRGEKIWSNLVELGVKPPKKWREMGVGKTQNRELPKWKSRNRNRVQVFDGVGGGRSRNAPEEEIIPTVYNSGKPSQTAETPAAMPLWHRL